MPPEVPLISIICAAYNRSNVLKYAVSTVLNSTFSDWELLVIGDACTDDSAEVVGSFEDPRISFYNLEKNTGEQSGPNNEGYRRSRGRYIAYISQDDLWFPDHLECALRGIRESGADLVYSLGIVPKPDGSLGLVGATPDSNYYPQNGIPASLWLMKRELVEQIGPWRNFRECYPPPSQDFLIRAWKAGKKMRRIPEITVIAVQSGNRKDVYKNREFEENEYYHEKIMGCPGFRERELIKLILQGLKNSKKTQFWRAVRRPCVLLARKAALSIGITPIELYSIVRNRRKGALIDRLRKTRGLSKLK